MSFFYAEPASGPSAGGIGWFYFGDFSINPGDTITGLTGTLRNGCTATFDLSLATIAGQPRAFTAGTAPVAGDAPFGRVGYTGLAGRAALSADGTTAGPCVNILTISNITMAEENGDPVPEFTVIAADAERTAVGQSWRYETNGGFWQLLTTLGAAPPTLTGLGTQVASIVGTLPRQAVEGAYLLTTQTPSRLIFTATGSGSGGQAQAIQVYAPPGHTYYINESMAPGSVSQMYLYTPVVSAVNATPGGSFPPTGSLPVSFTPALGDDLTYTIYNQRAYVYHKNVDKVSAEPGDILTYTVLIPNPYRITDVWFTDPTPPGMTYIGDLWVDKAYTGKDPESGLLVTEIPNNGSVTILWKTRIDGVTSFATTNIVIARVTMGKAVNSAYAQPGAFLSYTLTLHNTGNVAVTDVTLVPGSLTGAKGTFPTLHLNAPLAADGTAIISYQVKISDAIPTVNPITNSASAVFHYTVDATHPGSKTGTV